MPAGKRQSLLTLLSPSKVHWYFGFCANEERIPYWQRFFLRRDPKHITHVYAFCQCGNFVLFVEPTLHKIDFTIKFAENQEEGLCAYNLAHQIANAGHIVVKHEFSPNIRGKKTIWNWIPSCVSVVKVATGYASTARTPLKLLHCLLRDGGEFIYSEGLINGWINKEAKTKHGISG